MSCIVDLQKRTTTVYLTRPLPAPWLVRSPEVQESSNPTAGQESRNPGFQHTSSQKRMPRPCAPQVSRFSRDVARETQIKFGSKSLTLLARRRARNAKSSLAPNVSRFSRDVARETQLSSLAPNVSRFSRGVARETQFAPSVWTP